MTNSARAFRHPVLDSIGFPYPAYLGTVVRHTAVMWALVRLLFFVILAGGAGLSAALHPTWSTRIFLIAFTAFLVWWDRRRSHELLLHANLGARPGWFWAASLVTAAVLEGAMRLLRPVF
jgi:hypothetical protein